LTISPVFIYDSIKLSNRFVEPTISFRTTLNKLAAGQDAADLNFCQNGFWKELTNDLNKVSAEVKELRQLCNSTSTVDYDALNRHIPFGLSLKPLQV